MTVGGSNRQQTAETSDAVNRLFDRYERTGRPISVNFRQLVPWIRSGERATHYLHPYPGKLIPQIPAFFLANNIFSEPGQVVLDPFCGSGTVLLESVLHRRHGVGADSNPLALLISSAKVTTLTPETLRSDLRSILLSAKSIRRPEIPNVPNMRYWFYPHVIEQLSRLRVAIDNIVDGKAAKFFQVCFSACVRRVSLADPRLSVPVRLRENQYPKDHPFRESTNARIRRLRHQDVLAQFVELTENNISRVEAYRELRGSPTRTTFVGSDARKIGRGRNNDLSPSGYVDLIISSPPYVGAQKYIRASSLSLGWLGLLECTTLRELEEQNIGREHFSKRNLTGLLATGVTEADNLLKHLAKINLLRAHIAAVYLIEMRDALADMTAVLRPEGYLVLIAGSNRVCGRNFPTHIYLRRMLEDLGLVVRLRLVDSIRSRGLMTRRNVTASMITREWVIVVQKPASHHG